jgi:hypothetical protein
VVQISDVTLIMSLGTSMKPSVGSMAGHSFSLHQYARRRSDLSSGLNGVGLFRNGRNIECLALHVPVMYLI